MRAGFRLCAAALLGLAHCGPEPVDGEPFTDPDDEPVYRYDGAGGGASSTSEGDAEPSSREQSGAGESSDSDCCRTCTQGKACGDSCINRELSCQVGPGCACDG